MKAFKNYLFVICFTMIASVMTAQIGIGTTNPHTSSALEISSTSKGFLMPTLTEAQMTTLASTAAAGLMVLCNNCPAYVYVYTGAEWIAVGSEGTTQNTLSTNIYHNSFMYNDVRSITGTVWLDRNLGASAVATAIDHAEAFGDLYQWGRSNDGHQIRNSSKAAGPMASGNEVDTFITVAKFKFPNDWLSRQDDDRWYRASRDDPCPTGYSVPSEYALEKELNSWRTKNWIGALNSPLKLPPAGARLPSNGLLWEVGVIGTYWSSTPSGSNALFLTFNNITAYLNSLYRAYGFSVRCSKD